MAQAVADGGVVMVAAQAEPGELVGFFNDAIEGGSVSMTGVRIG